MNKTKQINIRVTENEYKKLKTKASNHGLTISTFLRNLSLNYPVTSIIDEKVSFEILKIAGDIGRLGGLFKYWLSLNIDEKPNFSANRSYKDIDLIVDEILVLQNELKNQALKIIKNDNKKSII